MKKSDEVEELQLEVQKLNHRLCEAKLLQRDMQEVFNKVLCRERTLFRKLVELQAVHVKLRGALTVALNYYADVGTEHWNLFDRTLSLPSEDAALQEMVFKTGEIMRERCIPHAWNSTNGEAIRKVPCVKIEDVIAEINESENGS